MRRGLCVPGVGNESICSRGAILEPFCGCFFWGDYFGAIWELLLSHLWLCWGHFGALLNYIPDKTFVQWVSSWLTGWAHGVQSVGFHLEPSQLMALLWESSPQLSVNFRVRR